MKKILVKKILVLAFFLSILPLAAARAADPPPGCNPKVMEALQARADLVRARNRAYEQQILTRPPSALYLTCFDRALARNARVGYLFSDLVPAAPRPADTVLYTGELAKYWGADQSVLRSEYNLFVTTGIYDNALTDGGFPPPWNAASNGLTALYGSANASFADIDNYLRADETAFSTAYKAKLQQITDYVTNLPEMPWDEMQTEMGSGGAYTNMKNELTGLEDYIVGKRRDVLGPRLTTLRTVIEAYNENCTRLDDYWAGKLGASLYAPEGDTFRPIPHTADGKPAPYLTPAQFLDQADDADVEAFFKDKSKYEAMLNTARDKNKLLTPGEDGSLWPPVPKVLDPETASADEIICVFAGKKVQDGKCQ